MTNGFVEQVFNWFTTPEELISIADKMEQVWKKSKVGDNNLVHTVCSGDENIRYAIKIRYDQERMLPKE